MRTTWQFLRPLRWRHLVPALVAGLVLLVSCGGGGGGGGGAAPAAVAAATIRVHYHRSDAAYAGWGIYSWQGTTVATPTWPANVPFNQNDSFGVFVDLPVDHTQSTMMFLVTDGNGNKNCGSNQSVNFNANIASVGQEIFLAQADCSIYATAVAALSPIRLGSAQAVWLAPDTMVWPGASPTATYKLYYAANGGMTPTATSVGGADGSYDVTPNGTLLAGSALGVKFRQYVGVPLLTVTAAGVGNVAALLKGQLVLVASVGGQPTAGTEVQTAPVIDAVYAPNATTKALGLSFDGSDVPTFRLWAPTATVVQLNIYPTATATVATAQPMMVLDTASGVWSYTAPDASWTNSAYYTYNVTVFTRTAGNTVVTSTGLTDPYAPSLNANGKYGMVLNLADAIAQPAGWPGALPATAAAPTDSVVYELHLRDFSAADGTVPAQHQGKFLAFTDSGSSGMTHLAALSAAGLTHVHILPAFDIASVDELACTTPTITPSTLADLGAANQVVATQNSDCYNWGYDPAHYGAPEGSYASNPNDGIARVKEFRQMVAALHGTGLRVIMDVVYNHTSGTGVLDPFVPGYYYRLDASGNVESDSCCADTAPEFAMMSKLMRDTLVTWAGQYKVDGFRFDIMGFIPLTELHAAKTAVDAVAVGDGRGHSYFYGEGWNFGHVANNALFAQSSQANLAGTGIGSFNDRIRDAVRGGGPFDSGAAMSANQGFTNGLCYDNNASNNSGGACTGAERLSLQYAGSLIRYSLAGNVASFMLNGTPGSQFCYGGGTPPACTGGQPAAYTQDPAENIAYISVHDNETVFDVGQYKHPLATTNADRARAQVVGLSLVLLSQGVPFIHAGDDLLRSKSMDSNSYNSGDYFNRINWDYATNALLDNWAVGAPPQNTGNNAANLSTMTNFLDTVPRPAASDIANTTAAFQDFLTIRKQRPEFRLATGAAVKNCVSFPDAGDPNEPDGLIVMRLATGASCGGSNTYKSIVVLFNANKAAQVYAIAGYINATVSLHPLQSSGSDAVVKGATFTKASGTFSVPARTTAVFVEQ